MAYLLDEVRLNGENKELVDEIIKLSKQYGIVTQYTSYIITEKDDVARNQIGGVFDRRTYSPGSGYNSMPMKAAESMVNASVAMKSMKMADKIEVNEGTHEVKSVLGRSFILRNKIWTDINYDDTKKYTEKSITFGSDEYFSFIEKNPQYLEILQLGEKINFVDGKVCYKII